MAYTSGWEAKKYPFSKRPSAVWKNSREDHMITWERIIFEKTKRKLFFKYLLGFGIHIFLSAMVGILNGKSENK